ncbi:MAG: hypothetical protein PVJ57_06550 [Phycisphaerae bacterium]
MVASIVPIIVGALATYFKPFIESQASFRSRVKLRRQALLEQLAVKHAALLQHVRQLPDGDLVRGDGREEPDLVGNLTDETFRLFAIFHRLETLRLVVRSAYTALLGTIILGAGGALASWLWIDARPWALPAGIILLSAQTGLVVLLYWASCRLETYEEIT